MHFAQSNRLLSVFRPQVIDSQPCNRCKPRAAQRILLLVKTAIALLVMALLLHHIHPEEIYRALLIARQNCIAAAFLLLFLNIYLQYARWSLLLHSQGQRDRRQALRSLLVGFTLGFITPGRIGEYGRGLFVDSVDRSSAVGLVVLDKLYGLLVITLLGASAVISILSPWPAGWTLLLNALLISAALCILVLLLHPQSWSRWSKGFAGLGRHSRWQGLSRAFRQFTAAQARGVLLLSLLHALVYLSQFVLLLRAFSDLAIFTAYRIAAATLFSKSMLPIAIGDLGIRESAAVFFCRNYNIEPAAAFNASVFLFLINLLVPALTGLAILLQSRVGVTSNE
ncbi:MAG TPA: lysylphosphatidylglycerol synthase transmembrane domain-containing protein [bacterium]|nr:lysylphosphatidylglycerol synthase transmembrane domain-containing protein [bacterium]HNT64720.1 lysylphosphatidylglycerol synthase transmembrane domain-containing protein [bacterium]HOX85881.1 lysylphosphatidylglycerol synthase transmembrane domain-containing protein [bacterium]HPG45136.1 lysylphosphatidylglycerol synthase transmembrane domain-containing protein [bacterium]